MSKHAKHYFLLLWKEGGGWVGCVTGRTRVDDGAEHTVGVEFDAGSNSYHVLVDGQRDGSGLHSVQDHPDTS